MIPEPQMPVTPVAAVASANPSFVGPEVAADDLDLSLQRVPVDAYPLDRAGRRALAGFDLRALEGRAGGRRRGQQPLPVAEHDLGIGADIDDQHRFIGPVRGFGQHHASRVGPHVARDAGQHVDARAGVDIEVDVSCLQGQPVRPREREGGTAQLGRIDAEQEVVHDRVADEACIQDVAPLCARLVRDFADQRIHRAAHGLGEFGLAAGVHHHVGHPAHEVLAKADLRIHATRRRDHRAARKFRQVAGDGGRADVEGGAEGPVAEAGPDGDDALTPVDGDRRRPLAVAERTLETLQDVQVAGELAEPPLVVERIGEALEVAARIVHVGFGRPRRSAAGSRDRW